MLEVPHNHNIERIFNFFLSLFRTLTCSV